MDWDYSLDFRSLAELYQRGARTPTSVAKDILERIAKYRDQNVYTYLLPEEEVLAQAGAVEKRRKSEGLDALPLYGLPFSIKDNIHVKGHPTSCACETFRHFPAETATIVVRAMAAGAILIGKLNLDQFANGLVGIRSPSGYCVNAFNPDYIPGGSSSGSGVAVAAGLAAFAFGSDTGGSGRVPAGLNNVVGLKPTRGFFSNTGSVPVNRSIDCLSVFALTCDDAYAVFEVVRGYDPIDRYSREDANMKLSNELPERFRFGIPGGSDLIFFGDRLAEAGFAKAVGRLVELGGTPIEIDFRPFRESSPMLFGSAFLAERLAGVQSFYMNHADKLHPVTRSIISAATKFSAVDAFDAQHRLKDLDRQARRVWQDIDVLVVPTTGTIHSIKTVEADPIPRNAEMGYYTYFVNLLDLCALAVPATIRSDGLPFGICLIAPAAKDASLYNLGERFSTGNGLSLGATGFLPSRSSS
jgi:allophanate hydrolase